VSDLAFKGRPKTGSIDEGTSLFGRGVEELWLKLAERSTFLERVRVAEEYLLPFALHALVRTPIMLSAQHIIRRMARPASTKLRTTQR
jgi:hypothetical protein